MNRKKTFKRIIPGLLFVFVFGIYLYTAPRGATNFADSNELMAASYIIGLPHPPGYPLFLILGKLFSFIPIGEIAFRYAIFTSFFGALTVVLVYLVVLKILGHESGEKPFAFHNLLPVVPALIGSLSLAFCYIFWLYSIVPEVFALLNFFTALLIYMAVCWHKEKQQEKGSKGQVGRDYAFWMALCFSLGFLSQQLIVVLIPPLLYIVFFTDRKVFNPSAKWLKILAGFAIGLLPLIYFPLASLTKPEIDYGNTTSFVRMWEYLTRRIYADVGQSGSAYLPAVFSLKESLGEIPYYLSLAAKHFGLTFFLIGLAGAGAIIFALGRKLYERQTAKSKNQEAASITGFNHLEIFVFLTLLFTGPLLGMYLTINLPGAGYNVMGAHERMFIFSFVSFAILIGISVRKILVFIDRIKLSVPMVSFILMCLPLILLASSWNRANKHDFTLGEDFAHDLFVNMEENAIFFTRGDMPSFAAYYYKYVKGERKDVTIIPFSMKDWALERLHQREPDLWDTESKDFILIIRDIIQDNIDKRPIYFTGIPDNHIIAFGIAANPFILSPRGLLARAGRDFDPIEKEDFWEKMNQKFPHEITGYNDWYSKEIFEQYVIGSYNSFLHYQKRGYYDLMEKELERMKGIDPYHHYVESAMMKYRLEGKKQREVVPFELGSSEDYLELGYKYLKNNWADAAMAEFWMAKQLDPKNTLPRLQLGKSYELLKWYDMALGEYRDMLEVEPGHQEALERIMVVEELMK